ncbi:MULTISPECIES: hypothetical protein [unclassified Wolbachia]|uniref:hypothetical protein n=1 Tax=unclassified Wolbachia TaxID=2640676 RepID=UPI0029084F57|nr:hypothetical protein [Wolbachia endosymbiont of Scaptomyza pallida]MDU8921660.1 hypothetical protein [Wolbachia endosymbiont of Scaptomyza pallida]
MVNINTKKQPAGFFIYLSGLSGSGKLSTAIELSNMINALRGCPETSKFKHIPSLT